MRHTKLFAALVALTSYTGLAQAQDNNLAEPAANDEPIDLTSRQAPWGRSDIDVSRKDRLYSVDASSSFVAVTDPVRGRLLGFIPLDRAVGPSPVVEPTLNFAPDGRTLAINLAQSSTVAFLDTRTNSVRRSVIVAGIPTGAFYTPNGKEAWIPVRGGDYISVRDAKTLDELARVAIPEGPGLMTFSNNGRYAYVCAMTGSRMIVVDTGKRAIIDRVANSSNSCSSIASSPNGRQVWFTAKEAGQAVALSTKPPFAVLRTVDTGPRSNAVNFVSNDDGQFAYVSVGGLGVVKVVDADTFDTVATLPVTGTPQGLWPSGDGSLMYVGLGNRNAIAVIDTAKQKLIDSLPVGQPAQAVAYVPYAIRSGHGLVNLQATAQGASSSVPAAGSDR